MKQSAIFGPFFALMLLSLIVWTYMYVRRISFITSNRLGQVQLAILGELGRISPAAVSNPSDNLKNLFELPVIFYPLVLYLHAVHQVDTVYLAAAWVFVGFRILHSLVHCTFNLIMLRFYLHFVGALALWFMGVRAAASYLFG